jgi:hypothetical protein
MAMEESNKKEDFGPLLDSTLPAAAEQAKVRQELMAVAARLSRVPRPTNVRTRLHPYALQAGDLDGAIEKLLAVEKRTRTVRALKALGLMRGVADSVVPRPARRPSPPKRRVVPFGPDRRRETRPPPAGSSWRSSACAGRPAT